MNANDSTHNPGFAGSVISFFRLYWLNLLILLALIGFGLRGGWATPRQWSDGLFWAGFAQIFIASTWLFGSEADISNASLMRYVKGGDVDASRREMIGEMFRKQSFGLRMFTGGVLTFLFAALALIIQVE